MRFLWISLFVFFLWGCEPPVAPSPLAKTGCTACHPMQLDAAHDIGCATCHQGNPQGITVDAAHEGLIAEPAHPDHMAAACGRCHPHEVERAERSAHFTLRDEVGQVWSTFFPEDPTPQLLDLPVEMLPSTPKTLVSDALRRRCLRCHVYSRGDDYTGTRHGTGCAACHLEPRPGGLGSHRFLRQVKEDRCLACHYGNFVGWDYVGRFEKDFDAGYRAPLLRGRHLPRPYGVEWHEMTPDVHAQAGMVCTDCHTLGPCQEKAPEGAPASLNAGCLACHGGPSQNGSKPGMILRADRPGHRIEDRSRVACAACHATWSFLDLGRSLVRQDSPDYDAWEPLKIQGSSEVEQLVDRNVQRPYAQRLFPAMQDKLSGAYRIGLWFEVFSHRWWGPVPLGEDAEGRLQVLRPLLDLSLSYVDYRDETRFNNLRPAFPEGTPKAGYLPYMPHTIGAADSFRTRTVEDWLAHPGSTP